MGTTPAPRASIHDPELAGRMARMSFHAPFRPYQELALKAFERQRAAGDTRLYLTMPPGSGKTVVGLEIARRLGRPTLVLGPNTAIQAQWLAEWRAFSPPLVEGSPSKRLGAPVTVLTYQALAIFDRRPEDLSAHDIEAAQGHPGEPRPGEPRPGEPHPGEPRGPRRGEPSEKEPRPGEPHSRPTATDRRRERLLITRGGDHDAVLGLLHENGRAIVRRLAAAGPVTVILDECHHLLDLWGHVLDALIAELDAASAVVGLTATPPREFGAREAALYRRLFGTHADFEVVTPAVVKDGFLAPYQELAYITAPTDVERQWIAGQQERFDQLRSDLLDPSFATTPFGAWFATRVIDRRTSSGVPVAWAVLEDADPDLARAALRWEWSRGRKRPPGAHYREEHRRAPEASDWIALLDGFVRDVLAPSTEPYDRTSLERIRKALPSIGYVLTRRGIRAGTSVVDRVLGLSAAKSSAAVQILEAEADVLRDRLRAVVLCDFETASRAVGGPLRGVLDPSAGSAAGALREILATPSTAGLDPVLVTGRTVACSRSTALRLVDYARTDPELGSVLEGFDPLALVAGAHPGMRRSAQPGWEDPVLVMPDHPDWTPRRWVPLVTGFFEEGQSRCLIGTRALLGEGWNSRRANVLIDLGGATTSVSVQQVRGRTLRLDPADPEKVADNWDVVVVAEGHLRGNADYERFARKHRHYYALSDTGEIESGVSHVDPTLGPFGPPPASTHAQLRETMLRRAEARPATRRGWRIGEPYRDVQIETVRIRLDRSPGLPGRRLFRGRPAEEPPSPRELFVPVGTIGAAAALGLGLVGDAPLVGGIAAAILGGASGGAALVGARDRLGRISSGATLGDMARALAEAMAASDAFGDGLGPGEVRIVPQPDGYYRCFLDGATEPEARRFAEALEQLVEPLWDPRWIIARRVDPPPRTLGATALLLLTRALRIPPAPDALAWHAVPDIACRSRRRVAAFERAWSTWVSPHARALPADDPAARAVLARRLGDDPFLVETQHRTLWT